jgi:hypothetical protein
MRTVITIFSLMLAGVFYQGANPPDRSAKTGDTSEQSKKEVKPLTVVPPPTTSDSLGTDICKQNKSNEQTSTNNSDQRFIHLITYLNAASTVVVAVFTILIWRVYRAMLRASKINERAWIVPVIGMIEPTQDPEKFQVKVTLRNNGKTPAWITAAGSNGKGATDQRPLPIVPPYTEMGPFYGKGTLLSPTGGFDQGFSLDKERLDHVQSGLSQLFIFGYAKYRDAYGDLHFVRYCFEARKSLDANHPHPLEFYVGGPAEYMGAD